MTAVAHSAAVDPVSAPQLDVARGKPRRTVWTVITGTVGGVVGLAPHLLHHAGPLVGTALVAGAGGTALFGFLGLVASVAVVVKLKSRFRSGRTPGSGGLPSGV